MPRCPFLAREFSAQTWALPLARVACARAHAGRVPTEYSQRIEALRRPMRTILPSTTCGSRWGVYATTDPTTKNEPAPTAAGNRRSASTGESRRVRSSTA